MRTMQRRKLLGNLTSQDLQQRQLRHFDDGDVTARGPSRRRCLEADPTTADDGYSPTPGEDRPQRHAVVERAQIVHVGEVASGHCKASRLRAGRQQQLVVLDTSAVLGDDLMGVSVDGRDPRVEE